MLKIFHAVFIAAMVISTQAFPQANLGKMLVTDHGPCVLHANLTCYDKSIENIRWEKKHYSDARYIIENSDRLIVAFHHQLVALDTLTAKPLWHTNFTSSPNELFFEPVIDGDFIYQATDQGVLHKIKISDGQPLWQIKVSKLWIYPPTVQAKLVITGGQDHLLKGLSKVTGETIWQSNLQSEIVYRPITLKDQNVIVSTFASDILKIDSRTGKQLWRKKLPSPAVYLEALDDHFLVGDYSGYASLHSVDTGQTIWRKEVNHSPFYWFNTNHSSIVFSNEQGKSTTLNLKDGHTIQVDNINQPLNSAPVFSENALVFFTIGSSGQREGIKPTRVLLTR